MKPGEAIDYLRGGANRRVSAADVNVPTMVRWRAGLECFLGGKWTQALITHFAEYDYEKTREIPLAPSGAAWSNVFVDEGPSLLINDTHIRHVAGMALRVTAISDTDDATSAVYRPITSLFERDVQAARVAEFDTRPEPDEASNAKCS